MSNVYIEQLKEHATRLYELIDDSSDFQPWPESVEPAALAYRKALWDAQTKLFELTAVRQAWIWSFKKA